MTHDMAKINMKHLYEKGNKTILNLKKSYLSIFFYHYIVIMTVT